MSKFFYISLCAITLICTPAYSFADNMNGKLGEYWDKTKEYSRDAWDNTSEIRKEGLEKSKKYGSKGWEKTKELAGEGWEKSKELGGEGWKKSKEYLDKRMGKKKREDGKMYPHKGGKKIEKGQIDL